MYFEPRLINVTGNKQSALRFLARSVYETPSRWVVVVGEDRTLVAQFLTHLDRVSEPFPLVMPNLGRDMHPKQQRSLVERLKATHPDDNVLASTDCPLVLAGCEPQEVWILEQSYATFSVRQADAHPMLCTGSELNQVFFGVSRANDIGEQARRYVEIATNRYRSDEDQVEMEANLAKLRKYSIPISCVPVERVST